MTTTRNKKPTPKATNTEMKVISRNAQRKMPTNLQDLVATYTEAKDLAAAEEIHFLKTLHSDLHWKRLVLQDITEEPKRQANETFKQYYKRAYSLWLKIYHAIHHADTSAGIYRDLFIKAFLNGYEKYAAVLIKKIDLNKKIEDEYLGNVANKNFIHECSFRGNNRMMKLLLEHKANPNVQGMGLCGYAESSTWVDGTGNTPLILAAVHGKKECAALLLTARADFNYKTTAWRNTALHEAVKSNHEPFVRLLLEANASLTIKDADDKLPIELAKEGSACEALLKKSMLEKNIAIPEPAKCVIQ